MFGKRPNFVTKSLNRRKTLKFLVVTNRGTSEGVPNVKLVRTHIGPSPLKVLKGPPRLYIDSDSWRREFPISPKEIPQDTIVSSKVEHTCNLSGPLEVFLLFQKRSGIP